jgi:hypothetical protein
MIVAKTIPPSAAETAARSSRSSRSQRYTALKSAAKPNARKDVHAAGTWTYIIL